VTTTTGPTTTTAPTTTTPTSAACQVTYHVDSQWQDGFTAEVTFRNTGGAAVNGWTLGWAFPGDQTITNAWNGTATQSAQNVTAHDAGWNASVPVNGTATLGFQATYSGTNSIPTSFRVNDSTCSVA
jgi:endoglucanase